MYMVDVIRYHDRATTLSDFDQSPIHQWSTLRPRLDLSAPVHSEESLSELLVHLIIHTRATALYAHMYIFDALYTSLFFCLTFLHVFHIISAGTGTGSGV